MKLSKLLLNTGKWLSAALLTSAAHAGYFQWDMVELPASSGASCGNGTPYRFFVNRTPFTSKTVVMFEGGGACWEKGTCENKSGTLLGAVNPSGIPTNYMSDFNRQPHWGLVTPFTARTHPLQTVQTQSWNIVYLTYCTGDVHTGNKVTTYSDDTGSTAWFHRGVVNAKAVTAWMAANLPKEPDVLLLTGFSAGGTGSTSLFPHMRTTLKAKKAALLADSGPLFWAPRDSTPEQSPSLPLHNKIRVVWGLDEPNGLVTELISKYPTAGDANNLGSLSYGLNKIFPQDRIGYTMFQEDTNYSAFSYEKFYPEISSGTPEARLAALNSRWRQDINNLVGRMPAAKNMGYYLPNYREINGSHCLTIVTFGDTGIAERKIAGLETFLDNLLDFSGKTSVIRAQEVSRVKAPAKSLSDWVARIIGEAGLF